MRQNCLVRHSFLRAFYIILKKISRGSQGGFGHFSPQNPLISALRGKLEKRYPGLPLIYHFLTGNLPPIGKLFRWVRMSNLKRKPGGVYSQLKPVACPTLQDEEVVFSRSGFDHLLRKGGIFRTKKDQLRRFSLLKYARTVLEKPDLEIIVREGTSAIFWKMSKNIGNKTVRVVVRQKETGPKHFFSIMDN